jgi:hypothetical protein
MTAALTAIIKAAETATMTAITVIENETPDSELGLLLVTPTALLVGAEHCGLQSAYVPN